jgi:plasmid stabilization system protein ParE
MEEQAAESMSPYALTPQAEDDLFEIWSYIHLDSPEAADRVEEAVYDACSFLSQSPGAGHRRVDIADEPVRFWPVTRYRDYVIVYDPTTRPIAILRILHGARNLMREIGR